MSNTRLTNELRNRISEAVLTHRFAPDEEALKKLEEDFGLAVYEAIYPEFLDRRKLVNAKVGEYPESDELSCYFNGQWTRVRLGGMKRLFYKHYNKSPKFGPDDNKILAEYDRLEKIRYKLRDARVEAAKKVKGVLAEASTVKKLIEIWPEVEPFIPPALAPVHLPAVPVAEVNALLGLTKE